MASKRAPPRGAGSSSGPEDGVNIQVILRCRPATKDETASRTPQVVKCNEALREITLDQTVGGKQFGRTYHFDRVRRGAWWLGMMRRWSCGDSGWWFDEKKQW